MKTGLKYKNVSQVPVHIGSPGLKVSFFIVTAAKTPNLRKEPCL
jgi:hypothetical protein